MREIKFRYFNKEDNKMYPVETLYFDKDGILKSQITYFGEIMQSTGLFDKHGKEIFEYDVLAITSSEKEIVTDEGHGPMNDYAQIKAVIFEKGSFGCDMDKDEVFYSGFTSLEEIRQDAGEDSIEIIGNIHENPELIK